MVRLLATSVSLAILAAHSVFAESVETFRAEGSDRYLASADRVLVMISANEPVLARIVEDAIAMDLVSMGYLVPSREQLESVLSTKLADSQSGAISAIDLATVLEADIVLSGTAVLDLAEDGSIEVKVASLEIINGRSADWVVRMLVPSVTPLGSLRSELKSLLLR